jgi:hypothetical protein
MRYVYRSDVRSNHLEGWALQIKGARFLSEDGPHQV